MVTTTISRAIYGQQIICLMRCYLLGAYLLKLKAH
jgi:hypothetical protein